MENFSTPASNMSIRKFHRSYNWNIYANVTDSNQTLWTLGGNISRTNDEIELPNVSEINASIMEKKQDYERTFYFSKPAKDKSEPSFFPDTIINSTTEFILINTSII